MSEKYENYQINAIRYAHHDRQARKNFIGADIHDGPTSMDYFFQAIVGRQRTIVVDIGFYTAMAGKRRHTLIHPVEEGLRRVGINPDRVKDVIVTPMHYDPTGNQHLFPAVTAHR